MNLFRAELRRLYVRRVTRWMLLTVVLVLAAIAVTTWATNEQVGPDTIAAAQERADRDFEEQLRWHRESIDQEIAECERSVAAGDGYWPPEFDCAELALWEPRREDFDPQWYMPSTFDFRSQFGETITVLAALLALYGFAVGASYVGVEWRSSGMMNLLLWRPRRLQVLGTKLVALLTSLLGLGVVLGLLWTAAYWLIGTYRGITDTMTAGVWGSLSLTGVRGLVLVLVSGAVGFTLASIGRHTALAMGAAVGAVVIGVVGVAIAAEVAGARYTQAWLWPTYLQAWMDKSVVIQDWRSCDFSFGQCEPATMEITWQTAGLLIAAVVALLLVVAMWQMRRRDVT